MEKHFVKVCAMLVKELMLNEVSKVEPEGEEGVIKELWVIIEENVVQL